MNADGVHDLILYIVIFCIVQIMWCGIYSEVQRGAGEGSSRLKVLFIPSFHSRSSLWNFYQQFFDLRMEMQSLSIS